MVEVLHLLRELIRAQALGRLRAIFSQVRKGSREGHRAVYDPFRYTSALEVPVQIHRESC
jgi:hypothetical protein